MSRRGLERNTSRIEESFALFLRLCSECILEMVRSCQDLIGNLIDICIQTANVIRIKNQSDRSIRTNVTIQACTREIHLELLSLLCSMYRWISMSLTTLRHNVCAYWKVRSLQLPKFVSQLRNWEQKRTFEMTRSTEISSGNETGICILRFIKCQYFKIYTENSIPDYQPLFRSDLHCTISVLPYSI